jgi:hypothetical protein
MNLTGRMQWQEVGKRSRLTDNSAPVENISAGRFLCTVRPCACSQNLEPSTAVPLS